jgi:copper(I)-binding protein
VRRLSLLAMLLAIPACGGGDGPAIVIEGAYAYEPVLGDVGAVYLTIVNHGVATDTVIGVEVSGALVAMIHEQVSDGDRMEMRHVGPLPVPAGGRVELAPGGYHVMLEGMAHPPAAGDTLDVTVRFTRAGSVAARAPVVPYGTER